MFFRFQTQINKALNYVMERVGVNSAKNYFLHFYAVFTLSIINPVS
jgi:hypothetical protein